MDYKQMLLDAIENATDIQHETAAGPYVEGYAHEIANAIIEEMEANDVVFYQP